MNFPLRRKGQGTKKEPEKRRKNKSAGIIIANGLCIAKGFKDVIGFNDLLLHPVVRPGEGSEKVQDVLGGLCLPCP